MKRYTPSTNYCMVEVGGSRTRAMPPTQFVLASDVADIERRYREAVKIIKQYHEWFDIAMCSSCGAVSMAYAETCGKDPYHDEAIGICKRARAFLAEEEA